MEKMNLPNKLTILRMVMIPLFIGALFWPNNSGFNYLVADLLFSAAALTDLLDGQIARKRGLVTNFGKLMDPLADKLLVVSALVCFVQLGLAPAVAVIIILAREFLITSVRMVALESGKVIAANIWGKMKTVFQMTAIVSSLLLMFVACFTGWVPRETAVTIVHILNWLSAFVTLVSGVTYIWSNRTLFIR